MGQVEIKKRKEKIKELSRQYREKIDDLRNEQDKIIADFMSELEQEKIKEIKNNLNI
jgi:hypothetical protein